MAQIILEDGATGKEIREALNAMMAELYAGGPSPSGNDPRPFKVTGRIYPESAATPVVLLDSTLLSADESVHVMSFFGFVAGDIAWSGAGNALFLQDQGDTPAQKLWGISKNALTAYAEVRDSDSANCDVYDDRMLFGGGTTRGVGLAIAADANFSAGSFLVITVYGFIIKNDPADVSVQQ